MLWTSCYPDPVNVPGVSEGGGPPVWRRRQGPLTQTEADGVFKDMAEGLRR